MRGGQGAPSCCSLQRREQATNMHRAWDGWPPRIDGAGSPQPSSRRHSKCGHSLCLQREPNPSYFFLGFSLQESVITNGPPSQPVRRCQPLAVCLESVLPPHPPRRALRFDLLEGNPALLGTPPQRALPLSFQLPLRHFRPLLASLP
jgi:hypothetical protein